MVRRLLADSRRFYRFVICYSIFELPSSSHDVPSSSEHTFDMSYSPAYRIAARVVF